MSNLVYENASLYFPILIENSVDWRVHDAYSIIITHKDGGLFFYDDIGHSMRHIPSSEEMTEELYKIEFGRKLRRLMYIRGLTQEDVAEMVGSSQDRISRYTNGKSMPGFFMVERLAKALDCPLDELACLY